jgi:hypothetical protein
MSMQKTGSPSSWLARTDGIAAQWQDLLLLLARILFGWTTRSILTDDRLPTWWTSHSQVRSI